MSALYVLVRLRVMEVLRVRSSGFFTLGLPLVFFVLVGVIFADGHPFERRHLAVLGDPDPAMIAVLDQHPEIRVERETSRTRAMGELRAHVVSAVLEREGPGWRLTVGPREEILGRGLVAILPAHVELAVVALPRWGFVHYTFPGILLFTVVISGLFGMGYNMVRYRQSLLLRKLSTTPLRRSTFILAQILGRGVMLLLQAMALLLVAWLVFALPLTLTAALLTFGLTALGLLCFLGVGFVLACFIKTEGIIYDTISAVCWPIVLLSEMFFPADELPSILPLIAKSLPSTQLARLLRSVLVYQDMRFEVLWPGLLILCGWTVAVFVCGWIFFKWND